MGQTPIVILTGPTGAGKTAASLHLAERFHGGIVNFDSRQVYEDFPVLTAQPSPEEQAQAPHALFGFLPCKKKISAGEFVLQASQAIENMHRAGYLPILVGGTGLYMKALLEGLAPIPRVREEITEKLHDDLNQLGLDVLYERLQRFDPEYADKIAPTDRQRVMRALEVYYSTGETMTSWHDRPVPTPSYRALKIGLQIALEDLEPILELRIDKMLESGAVEEAKRAWKKCPDPDAPGWTGIGCSEVLRYIRGELGSNETIALWIKNTRAYAKRQLTWFRKERDMHWLEPHDLPGMERLVEEFLAKESA